LTLPSGAVSKVRSYKKIKKKNVSKRSCIKKLKRTPSLLNITSRSRAVLISKNLKEPLPFEYYLQEPCQRCVPTKK
jgi:hypothetical protein